MANRAFILVAIMLICCTAARSQTPTYQQVDSISYAQYQAGKWKTLIDYGNSAIAAKIDYPLLRFAYGLCAISAGNYSGALVHYQKVLNEDSHNQTARYLSYLCNKYLNRENEAAYHAGYVDTATLNNGHVKPFAALSAGFEASLKTSNRSTRGAGIYGRASLSNRLGYKLILDQSVASYSQSITSNIPIIQVPTGGLFTGVSNNLSYTDSQFEYYAKLGYAINSHWTVLGAYHYLYTAFGQTSYNSHVGLAGVRYNHPYFSLQADANAAQIINDKFQQYNGQLNIYPLGNLNLYTISRLSVQTNGLQQTIFNQSIGFKTTKRLWFEVSAGFGKMDNYLDADALYVYNAIDITQNKAGATAFYSFGAYAIVYLNYTFEQKQDYYLNTNYNQNSITGGITWKF